ncbi:N-acetyltransferase, partial [Bifidobacteriaceae bacterium NR015]
MEDITLRKATLGDLRNIEHIYENARKFMRVTGNPHQWGNSFPLVSSVIEDIRLKRFYLIVDEDPESHNERILAQFALCEGVDEV